MDNPKIHIALRFSVEMSHMDETDENLVEKDIGTLNHIIRSLNVLNAEGIDVKGTWSIEKDFTYQNIMPKYCAGLLEKINLRLKNGDELDLTTPSNVMLTVLDNKECKHILKECVKQNVENPLDVYNKTAPIFCPSNNMMSPSLIPFFKSIGMSAVGMNYSNSANSSFTNLIPQQSVEKRFNPIDYKNPTTDEKITMLPSINATDILSGFGIKRYLHKMRKAQMACESPTDLLLLIDIPFQDDFWYGYFSKRNSPSQDSHKMNYGGVYKLVSTISKIRYTNFTTPYEYLKNHQSKGEMKIPHDLANGSFEGYCNFAEKWENTNLFKDVEKARYNAYVASGLAKLNKIDLSTENQDVLEKRIKALNAVFYDQTAPKVNSEKLCLGAEAVEIALKSSIEMLDKVASEGKQGKIKLFVDNPYLYMNDNACGVVFIDSNKAGECKYALNGKILRSFRLPHKKVDGIVLNNTHGVIELDAMPCEQTYVVKNNSKRIENEQIKLILLPSGAVKLIYKNEEFIKRAFRPMIKYKGKVLNGTIVDTEKYNLGDVQVLKIIGEIQIGKIKSFYEYSFTIVSNVSAVYFDGFISYPKTSEKKSTINGKSKCEPYDNKYEEIMPFEISLSMKATDEKPFKITKQNFFCEQTTIVLDNGRVSKNRHLDSFNNHITAGYVAVSNGEKGILLSECVDKDFSFAFCPMRLNYSLGDYSLKLNPFGTYSGKQRKNNMAKSGFSNYIARKLPNNFHSQAPSYNGKTTEVSMMIAPFFGEVPSEEVIRTGLLSAYPPKQI